MARQRNAPQAHPRPKLPTKSKLRYIQSGKSSEYTTTLRRQPNSIAVNVTLKNIIAVLSANLANRRPAMENKARIPNKIEKR
jgi:hypothetical protein